MKIVCSQCEREYNFTNDQISRFKYSVFPCIVCKKLIKIAACPHCGTYYSITFSSANRDLYKLNCMKCNNDFTVSFPVIDENSTPQTVREKQSEITKGSIATSHSNKEDIGRDQFDPFFKNKRMEPAEERKFDDFHLNDFITLLRKGLTGKKLLVAGAGILSMSIITLGYNALIALLRENELITRVSIIRDFLNLFPIALIFYLYLLTASAISKITVSEEKGIALSYGDIVNHTGKVLAPLTIGNLLLALTATSLLFLFGNIPVVGPVIFSFLYLPLYLLSVAVAVIIFIGIWFIPPLSVFHSNLTGLSKSFGLFLYRHHLKLVFIVPVIILFSGIVFAFFYFIHFVSYSLLGLIGDILLMDEGIRIYSAVPSNLLELFGLSLFGADTSIFRTLLGNLNASHYIAGFIVGTALSVITVVLYSMMISIIATFATYIYTGIDSRVEIDEKRIIQILAILVLLLTAVILFKKAFF